MLEINRSMVDKTTEILELVANDLSVKILPETGNLIYSLMKAGTEYLWFPYDHPAEYVKQPRLAGIPLLAPWANRLDEDGFDFNGTHYSLNTSIDFSRDANGLPIHGFLAFTDKWHRHSEIITDSYVEVTSHLKFWKYTEFMTHFPFPHKLIMCYRLFTDHLEIELEIKNLGEQSMPVMIGFHPYFQLPDSKRANWKVTIPATKQLVLNDLKLPTGMMIANPFQTSKILGTTTLDHVYTQLSSSPFLASSKRHNISVSFDSGYSAAVVYAPLTRDIICFEPMSAPTNSLARYHRDKSVPLPVVQPNSSWKGKFSIYIS